MAFETLRIQHGDVSAEIVPERGAIVSSLKVRGKDVLYMDTSTLEDATKNVRGGIPLLFPYAGKLVDEIFVHAGTKMKQHGFARNKAWPASEKSAFARAPDAEAGRRHRRAVPLQIHGGILSDDSA